MFLSVYRTIINQCLVAKRLIAERTIEMINDGRISSNMLQSELDDKINTKSIRKQSLFENFK